MSEGFNYTTDLGEGGVDLGKIYDYDLILLDLDLRDMSGMDEPVAKIIGVFICKLRKKLDLAGGRASYIETVWAAGTSCAIATAPKRRPNPVGARPVFCAETGSPLRRIRSPSPTSPLRQRRTPTLNLRPQSEAGEAPAPPVTGEA